MRYDRSLDEFFFYLSFKLANMKSAIVGFAVLFISMSAFCQEDSEYDENYEFPETKNVSINIGLGFGIDYGMFGAKLSFHPVKYIALSAALGWNFIGAGYNGGISFRMLPDKRVCPLLGVVYGYNTTYLSANSNESKAYDGFTIGTGIELHRASKPNFWHFGLNFPIRSDEFRRDENIYKQDPGYVAPIPVGITVGYHFSL